MLFPFTMLTLRYIIICVKNILKGKQFFREIFFTDIHTNAEIGSIKEVISFTKILTKCTYIILLKVKAAQNCWNSKPMPYKNSYIAFLKLSNRRGNEYVAALKVTEAACLQQFWHNWAIPLKLSKTTKDRQVALSGLQKRRWVARLLYIQLSKVIR